MNFYNEVLNVLKSDERFFSDDGQLLRNAVYEAASAKKEIIRRPIANRVHGNLTPAGFSASSVEKYR